MDNTTILIDNFNIFDDWEDKYRYLIDLGNELDPLSQDEYNEINKVDGCMSQVWLTHNFDEINNNLQFKGDSDALIVKGLIAVLLKLYNQKNPEQITELNIEEIFTKMGLNEHISPNRRNGFYAMVNKIKYFAQLYNNK
ncbi:MAG: SufE family protein [Pseudomonadota bacterium]